MKFEEIVNGKEEFRIGYLGGSITEGCGASKPDFRYTTLFTTMLNKRIPETKFIEINAGVGGTGSNLGLFRLRPELLDKKIDMLFVEFAVNDAGYGDKSFKFYEGIFRAARRYNPNLPIVSLFTYARGEYDNGPDSNMVRNEKKIAEAYGAPCVEMGYEVHQKIKDYGGDVSSFTQDGVHPNDYGYKSYVDSMMRDVFSKEFSFTFPEEPVFGVEFNNPGMIKAEELELTHGFKMSKKTLWNSDLHYACGDIPGSYVETEFEGTTVGLYTRFEKDSGTFDLYIDGQFVRNQTTWDKYCNDFDRNAHVQLAENLPFGKHTVKIVVSDKNQPDSEGHVIRVASFLVG